VLAALNFAYLGTFLLDLQVYLSFLSVVVAYSRQIVNQTSNLIFHVRIQNPANIPPNSRPRSVTAAGSFDSPPLLWDISSAVVKIRILIPDHEHDKERSRSSTLPLL
jgi:hypothetical protein